jgi:hypothetical protein
MDEGKMGKPRLQARNRKSKGGMHMDLFHFPISFALISVGLAAAQNGSGGFRYLEYPDVRPGKVLKAIKTLDPATGRIEARVYEDGSELGASIAQLEQGQAAVRASRNGKLGEGLAAALPNLNPNDKVKVSIHLKHPPIYYPDKTRVSRDEARAASIAVAALPPTVNLGAFMRRYGFLNLATRGNNIAEGELTRIQIESLKNDADIGAVDIQSDDSPMSPELSTLAASAYNPSPVPSSSGAGVRAATFENGLTASFLSCIGVNPAAWDANITGDQYQIRHANAGFTCLVRMAPSASFYHRSTVTFDGTGDINYLINNGIQSASSAWGRGGKNPYRSTYSEFLVMDDFAYRYPYPVFINGTGNAGSAYEVNWQCYNALNVGNVRHTNNSTYELTDCTQTKNPPPTYGSCISGTGPDCAGDREMPYVVIPGTPYSGSEFSTTCLGGADALNCGTSWSAAIGNGLVADVISADSRMVSWPEKVRAAIILTAHNVDGGHWSTVTDGRDGSGAVSGADAVAFAQSYTSVSPGNSAVEKGMGTGSLYGSDFGAGNKRFNFYVPNPKPSGKHMRAVVTWDSNPIVGGSTNALSDLDLVVQKNGGVQSSTSWDGNVEVVDIAASDLSAGGSYYIDINPAINRIPTSGARTNFFYYAIAWGWVKDHAD